MVDLFVDAALATSKGDARRSITGGSININNQRITDASQTVTLNDAVEGQFMVLRKGKKRYHLVRIAA